MKFYKEGKKRKFASKRRSLKGTHFICHQSFGGDRSLRVNGNTCHWGLSSIAPQCPWESSIRWGTPDPFLLPHCSLEAATLTPGTPNLDCHDAGNWAGSEVRGHIVVVAAASVTAAVSHQGSLPAFFLLPDLPELPGPAAPEGSVAPSMCL